MIMANKEWFKFSKGKAKGILFYYGAIFIFGLLLALTGILDETFLKSFTISEKSIIASSGFALLGSIIFYSKKIYKSCVNLEFEVPLDEKDRIREFGILIYFIFRPFFSLAFCFLMFLLLKLGCKIVTISEESLNIGFLHLTSFLGFFCGYSSGDVIDLLETRSKGIINKVFNNNPL